MNRNRILVTAAAVIVIVGVAIVAVPRLHADTHQANLTVQASVSANCRLTGGTLNFGAYDPVVANVGTDLDNTGTFTVACTKSAANVWIGMDGGVNYSGGRRMQVGATGNYLSYELYKEAARTNVWGNTQPTGVDYTPTSKAPTTLTVYGRVPQNQDVAVGSYTDTVVMTVNF